MKKIIIIGTLLLSSVLYSCSTKTETKMEKTIHMNKEMFITKVMNYESNPDTWNYLGDKPCIIDFYADWCAPCKGLAPTLEQLAQEYEGKVDIYKINVDEEQELSALFSIRSVPTLLFCPVDGQPQMAQGALSKEDLKRAMKDIFKVD